MKITFLVFLAAFLLVNVQIEKLFSVKADSHFDSYRNDILWKEEIIHLDNFAIYLKRHPEMNGYIAFYISNKDSIKRISNRITKAKKYLIKNYKIDEKRIIIINAGKLDSSITILQPADKDSPPPNFGF